MLTPTLNIWLVFWFTVALVNQPIVILQNGRISFNIPKKTRCLHTRWPVYRLQQIEIGAPNESETASLFASEARLFQWLVSIEVVLFFALIQNLFCLFISESSWFLFPPGGLRCTFHETGTAAAAFRFGFLLAPVNIYVLITTFPCLWEPLSPAGWGKSINSCISVLKHYWVGEKIMIRFA